MPPHPPIQSLSPPFPLPHPLRLLPSLPPPTPHHRPLPQIQAHHRLHTPHIMLLLPHIRQPGPARALLPPLHDLDALDIGAVDLHPHLDADARQLVAQQDAGVDAAAADVDAHAGERVARSLPHQQDVADLGAVRVGLGEERGARAGRVEERYLRGLDGGDGLFEARGGRGRRGVGFDFALY